MKRSFRTFLVQIFLQTDLYIYVAYRSATAPL
nr:MAG TPA: hypothetical protein [Caudoviricetes sp.]